MWVMHVERVKGDYIEPEIIDLEDGSGCLFRLHESDIHEDGPALLSELLTDQARKWAVRPPGQVGPMIPVRWFRDASLRHRLNAGVGDNSGLIIYHVHPDLISQHAADRLGHDLTQRSPYWRRVPVGYYGDNGAE